MIIEYGDICMLVMCVCECMLSISNHVLQECSFRHVVFSKVVDYIWFMCSAPEKIYLNVYFTRFNILLVVPNLLPRANLYIGVRYFSLYPSAPRILNITHDFKKGKRHN